MMFKEAYFKRADSNELVPIPDEMKLFCFSSFLFVWVVGFVLASEEPDSEVTEKRDVSNVKRSVLQFYTMIRSQTGRDPMDYNGYGCWCGYGGKGTPLDGVDRCCQRHDWCYNRIIRRGYCGRYEVYRKNYYYWGLKCYTGWGSSRCGRSLCYCDVRAVKCFKRNYFNRRYKNWNKNSC